jgi:malonate decarboxylase beta subunit
MNGPEVIEQEAGIAEMDASDRAAIWKLIGGEQRYATDLADALVEDDVDAIAAQVRQAQQTPAGLPRSAAVERFRARLERIDPEHPPQTAELRRVWTRSAP